ncbi:P-loop containing nucleoside triphosphate hydrolase protein [Dipodascopsis tothii]|uniref:P-loop containing nucleoside triphosphate hydrolase protein n=1 Tax=Dipodascopsis tothii TaxID=44089 RepID=UPI0034CFD6C7
MRVRRPTSKRRTTKHTEGIKKKVAAHHRKAKKLAKKDPTWKSRVKKDPGIPASFPYKNQILQQIEEEKQARAEEKARKRQEKAEARAQAAATGMPVDEAEEMETDDEEDAGEGSMSALLEYARRAAKAHADDEDDDDDEMESASEMDEDDAVDVGDIGEDWDNSGAASRESSRKSFDKIFKKVVDVADVILYVLDARDPEGTRSREVEQAVMAALDKRLIFVLNKVDLVPAHVQKGWEAYLKNVFPTIALRATVAGSNIPNQNSKAITPQSTSATLMRSLKAYASRSNLKRSITVGVIGYPNVGKSSVINALTTRTGGAGSACPVGAEAGVTTALREVKIDGKLKVLDSPGIVFPSSATKSDESSEEARLMLLGAIPPKQIVDAQPAVSLLLNRLSGQPELYKKLIEFYDLPALVPKIGPDGALDRTTDFLVHVARKKGRIGRGGIPNLPAAAISVINDWRDGRIPRWIEAPTAAEVDKRSAPAKGKKKGSEPASQKEIVTEWAKEFSLDGLWENNADDE